MNRLKSVIIIIITMIGFALLNSACAPRAQEPATATIPASSTPLPSRTPTLTPPPTATITPTAPPTATATPTEEPPSGLVEARYYASGRLSGWRFFIAIQSAEKIEGEYYAIFDDNKEYRCEVLPVYPNRLYCSGRLPAFGDWASYVIFEKAQERAVFKGEVYIPLN